MLGNALNQWLQAGSSHIFGQFWDDDIDPSFSWVHWLPTIHWPQDPMPELVDLKLRQMDGSGNNGNHEQWGSAGVEFTRLTPANYLDDVSVPESPRTNYRELSNDVIKQDAEIANTAGVSDLFTFFGQFLDHDIDIAHEGIEDGPFIIAPEDDDYFHFQGAELGIGRSAPFAGTGTDSLNPREHANAITSYIDASNVYGSSDEVLESLRDSEQPWHLSTTSDGNLLPIGEGPGAQFQAGDIRAGENSALTSVHTIWAMEHNRIAENLRLLYPDWTSDQVFNAAKIQVEALMQHIVYDEWLPLLVGAENIPSYSGYNAHVDPSVSHEFASAAFRFGHSLLSSNIERLDEAGNSTGTLQLSQMFFNAAILRDEGSVDTLIRGLSSNTAQELDHHLVEDVRSLLFPGPDGIQVRDLSVLNNLRGLDHGLGTLNEVREALGLTPYETFQDLTGDAALAAKLAQHYSSVDEVDLWIGGLIEPQVLGSQLGETFQYIVVEQFVRLRDGDQYYYEERLEDFPGLLDEIKATTFSDIIQRNTDIDYLQDDVFIAHVRIAGSDQNNKINGTGSHDLILGFGGRDKIKAKDGDDDIFAGAGHDKVWGGKGNDIICGEEGNDWLHGGRGSDLFVFEQGSGRDHVAGFNVRHDTLDISDYGFTNMWDVYECATWSRKGLVITLDEGSSDRVTLEGVRLHQLDESNFIFATQEEWVV